MNKYMYTSESTPFALQLFYCSSISIFTCILFYDITKSVGSKNSKKISRSLEFCGIMGFTLFALNYF